MKRTKFNHLVIPEYLVFNQDYAIEKFQSIDNDRLHYEKIRYANLNYLDINAIQKNC
ncbi:MAG: hypothetical protein KJ971_00450 [Firmicutes bacterium]|nr:hypothetical protein [Bacillota bacterium]